MGKLSESDITKIRAVIGESSLFRLILSVKNAKSKGRLLFWQQSVLETLEVETGLAVNSLDGFINQFEGLDAVVPYPGYTDKIDLSESGNLRVFDWMKLANPSSLQITNTIKEVSDCYQSGCHPDVIERILITLCEYLPAVSPACVEGRPCAVNVETQQIVAVCMGTRYFVRVPAQHLAEARRVASTTPIFNDTSFDIDAELGADWVVGEFEDREVDWLDG